MGNPNQGVATMRMKVICTMFMLVMFAAAASAQACSGSMGSSQQSTPSTSSSPSTTPDQSSTSSTSGQSTTSSSEQNANSQTTTTQTTTTQTTTTKDEKSLSGCIRSQNGSFVLEEKNGKFAKLNSTEDLSAHVGHAVKVRGNWQAGSASSTSNPS